MLAAILLAASSVQSTMAVRPEDRPLTTARLNAGQMFSLADYALEGGNSAAAAKIYRVLGHDPDPKIQAEARFRLAKLLAKEGRSTEAATLLRHVIDDNPDAAPPRLELVALLNGLGDESGALRELRSLSTLDLPINVARFVDRMSASLRASQPFAFQLELAVAPDSNINRATTSNTLGTVFGDFTFDEDAKAHSGVGAAVRSFAQGRLELSPDAALKAHASLDANVYRDHEFNDVGLELAAGPEFYLGTVRFGAEAGAGQQWYGMHSYQRSFRLSGSAWVKVDGASQLRLDGSARRANNQFNDLQDGKGIAFAARYERALSPRLTLSLGSSVDRFRARDDAYSTSSWSLAASVYQDVGRTTLDVGGELGRLKADDRLALFPNAREDRVTRFHLGAVFRQMTVAGFAPTMRLVIERNHSTIEYYDYKRRRTEFGISRAF